MENVTKQDEVSKSELIEGLGANDCTWTQEDWGCDTYNTSCGQDFSVIDGTPEDNGFRFCCFCGKELVEELYEIRSDDEG